MMYGGGSSHPAMPKDLNLPFPTEPDHHHHLQQQQMGSPGLMKYRSAPSTLLEDFLPHSRPSPQEAAAAAAAAESMMLAGFMGDHQLGEKQRRNTTQFIASSSSMGGGDGGGGGRGGAGGDDGEATQQVARVNNNNNMLQSPQQQLFPNLSCTATSTSASTTSPHLVRQGSSPSALFSHHLNVDTGEYYRGSMKEQLSFQSRQGPGGFMAPISEEGGEDNGNGNGMTRSYIPGYPLASWEDSVLLSESFAAAGAKRGREYPSEPENGGARNHHQLTQHLSIPKLTVPAEIGVERFLQFQDAVPCMVRAKRGCATHPRSIAERVRRTKISERMRKLQELVPNMDKQTSTADMLELAVEYIKDLQRSVQALTESKAKCTCESMQKRP